MPEEIEIETKELQETLHELQEERREREEEERKTSWTRYIALTTAILAVFAAIGALQSGTLVNEAMMRQLRASDTWNEYQASRGKDHLYTIQANSFLDRGITPPPEEEKPAEASAHEGKSVETKAEGGKSAEKERAWKALPPEQRLAAYLGQVKKEGDKEKDLQEKAKGLEEESEQLMRLHEQFARAVALIQVAIALSAVAALTRIKLIWLLGSAAGLLGIVFFALGFLHGH